MADPVATSPYVSLLTLLTLTLAATAYAGWKAGPTGQGDPGDQGSVGPDPPGPDPTGATAPGPEPTGPTAPLSCANVVCARPLCADPETPPGSCCPSCAQSECKFEGCVQLRPQLQWRPEPCMICRCNNGKRMCGSMGCPGPLECFGNPIIPALSSPSLCFPRCDFGVPEAGCKAVPFRTKPFTLSHSSSTCAGEIIQHQCDKIGFRKNGKLFRCKAQFASRYVPVSDCDPFMRVSHRDVKYCRPVRDETVDGADGCDFIVPGPTDQPPTLPTACLDPPGPPDSK